MQWEKREKIYEGFFCHPFFSRGFPFALPFISLIGLWWNNWFLLLPTGAMVQLFYSTFKFSCMYGDPSDISLIPLSFISLILWNLAGLFLAAKLFSAYSAAGFGASS